MHGTVHGNRHGLLIGRGRVVVYRSSEAKGGWCGRRWCLEILILRRPKLRLDLELKLLTHVVHRVLHGYARGVGRLRLTGTA